MSSGKVLEVPKASLDVGRQIQQMDDHGSLNQIWSLLAVGGRAGGGGEFKVETLTPPPAGSSHLLLDANGSGTTDHTAVIQWRDENHPNQWWAFEPARPFGSGKFLIWPVHAGNQLVMDVTDASDDSGAPIPVVPSTWARQSAVASGGNVAQLRTVTSRDGRYSALAAPAGAGRGRGTESPRLRQMPASAPAPTSPRSHSPSCPTCQAATCCPPTPASRSSPTYQTRASSGSRSSPATRAA